MCFAYFLQFVDKLILSQATLFNLREDLVRSPALYQPFSCLIGIELARKPVLVDIGHLLLWLPRMELAQFVSPRPTPNWKVPWNYNVCFPYALYQRVRLREKLPLGRYSDVPRSKQELRRPHDSQVLPRGRRGGSCPRLLIDRWNVLYKKGAASTVCPFPHFRQLHAN